MTQLVRQTTYILNKYLPWDSEDETTVFDVEFLKFKNLLSKYEEAPVESCEFCSNCAGSKNVVFDTISVVLCTKKFLFSSKWIDDVGVSTAGDEME